jgi:hypothetical protein
MPKVGANGSPLTRLVSSKTAKRDVAVGINLQTGPCREPSLLLERSAPNTFARCCVLIMAPTPDAITFANDKSSVDVEQTPSSDDEISEQVGNFETDQNGLPPGYFTSRFFVGTMLAIGLGLFSGTAGFKFAGPVLAVINAELGPVSEVLWQHAWNGRLTAVVQDPDYIWISLIYTLASAITLLLIGRISDVFGRR